MLTIRPATEDPFTGRGSTIAAVVATAVTPGRGGTVLIGPPGVGKSFVLDRAAAILARSGSPVVRLAGDPRAAGIPFGTFRAILPPTGPAPGGWAELVRAGIDHLTADPEGPATVVVADDLHQFDAGSATIIHQGVVTGRFRLLGSARAATPVPDSISRLWGDGLVDRDDLRPLDRASAERLACDLLGGPLEGASEQRLWGWTQGNPLFLRELIASAQEAGAVQAVRGLWRIRGEVAGSDGLRALLGVRLATCSPAVREVARTLAVAEHLPAVLLERVAGAAAVAEAERAEVISVADDERLECRLGHPLHGEVIRHELGPDGIRLRQEALLDAATELGLTQQADQVLLAVWHLETERSSPETVGLLTSAARTAWTANDSGLAVRLARRAWALAHDPETGLLLCEALLRQGKGEEMTAVAERLVATAEDDAVRAAAVSYLATAIRIWRNEPEEAIALAHRSAERIADPEHRHTLDLLVASADLDLGRAEAAIAGAERVIRTGSPTSVSAALMILVPALSSLGRLDDAVHEADQAIAAAIGSGGQALNDLGAHLLFRVDSASMQGGLDGAVATLEPSYPAAAASGDALAVAWLTLVLARVESRRGRASSALRWFNEALAGFTDLHRPGWEVWAQAGVAQCLALVGRQAEAEAAAEVVRSLDRWRIPFGDPDVRRALAWVRLGSGDHHGACIELHAAAEQAAAQSEHFNRAVLLHDLVRLGDRGAVAPLRDLGHTIPSRLVAAWAEQARAWSEDDRPGLGEVAATFLAEGAIIDAAESEALVADSARRAGDERGAASAAQRAAALVSRCGPVRTPILTALDRPELTKRERHIARLAAAGRSRREIAEDLFLSVRTVDSHLQRIYRKLGVSNTAGLVRALPSDDD